MVLDGCEALSLIDVILEMGVLLAWVSFIIGASAAMYIIASWQPKPFSWL